MSGINPIGHGGGGGFDPDRKKRPDERAEEARRLWEERKKRLEKKKEEGKVQDIIEETRQRLPGAYTDDEGNDRIDFLA